MKTLLFAIPFALALTLPLSAAGLDDLAFLSGHWGAKVGNVEMEEIWSAPAGGMLIGMHRDVKAKRTSFEFMRIEQTADGIVFFAQPSGRPQTPFPLVESSANRAVFANPQHDFPQRIIYTLQDGRLCARVEGAGESAEEWCWERR